MSVRGPRPTARSGTVTKPLNCFKFCVSLAIFLKQQEPTTNVDTQCVIIQGAEFNLFDAERVKAAGASGAMAGYGAKI